jgi:alkylation response protein AidB-like acyl-CoA dehydrogenase
MLASQIGILERQLESAVDYARTREQFGQAVGKFQAVSNRIADMKVRLEASRLFVYRVAMLKAQGRSAPLEAAMAKLCLGEALVSSSLDLIRVHGGHGYLTATGVERELRDAVGTVLYGGTSDIQRVVIARLLGL